ncbi:hypothetical protein ASPZODRAFT_681638 [Penicilliopsis zonata CBS 506.65]|uniref:Uncharacterized protein n=1 Tax=Penicilliopsis zonata CBS 506.65 TaxID=1073090 RepID=A0A1L9SBF2_9EURO|nr:hypothetical protein ASPZODRAFT_681638 [Penicilliopsis zonata CBS 506.65]OJJ44510.1 hypothetical protein ASPZODRAFT_681638 [Penicilliopsis zonata CBS 506.65]
MLKRQAQPVSKLQMVRSGQGRISRTSSDTLRSTDSICVVFFLSFFFFFLQNFASLVSTTALSMSSGKADHDHPSPDHCGISRSSISRLGSLDLADPRPSSVGLIWEDKTQESTTAWCTLPCTAYALISYAEHLQFQLGGYTPWSMVLV